jgi:hypothetical protein
VHNFQRASTKERQLPPALFALPPNPSPLTLPDPSRDHSFTLPCCPVAVAGFVGSSAPELVLNAVRSRFDRTGHPRRLGVVMVASVGNSKGRGADVLAVEGLVE